MNTYFNKDFPIYCIAISKRKEHCIRFFNKLNFNVEYPEIVLKKDVNCSKAYSNKIIIPEYKCNKYAGKIACSLSHIKILKTFLKTNYKYCLIFEDDNIIPNNNEVKKIHSILNNILPKYGSWDLINLSPCWSFCSIQVKSNFDQNLYTPLTSVCRNAYAITRKGAYEFIKIAFPLIRGSDGGDCKLKFVNNSYDLHPGLFNQDRNNMGTTIGENNYLTECTECTFQYKFLTLSLALALFILFKIRNNILILKIKNNTLLFDFIIFGTILLGVLSICIQSRSYYITYD